MKMSCFYVYICLIVGVQSGVSIEQNVSLDKWILESMTNNPDLQMAQSDLAIARGERRAVGQWKNPEVSTQLGEKRVSDRLSGDLTAKGGVHSFGWSQTFEFPGKAGLRKAIADHDIRLAELALEQLKLEVAAEARWLAICWAVSEQETRVAGEVAERSKTLSEMLGKRSPAGVQFLLDQKIVEASRVHVLHKARLAEENLEFHRMSINLFRGRDLNEKVTLPVSLDSPGLNATWAGLWHETCQGNLEIQASSQSLERAGKQLSRSQLETAPDFTISSFYSEERAVDRERVLGVGISMPLPLWDSGRGRTEMARAGVDRAEAFRAKTVRSVQRRLSEEWIAWQLAVKQLEQTPFQTIIQLRESAELADRQYRLGAVDIPIYIEMQNQYLEASFSLLDAMRDVHRHRLNIQLLIADKKLLPTVEKLEVKP